MKRKIWKRLIIVTGSVFLLLVITLFVHIMMVTKKDTVQDLRKRQLSRIDLTQSVDSLKAIEITQTIREMEGVRVAKFGFSEKAIVYELDPSVQSPDKIVAALENKGYPVKKFEINKKDMANGCPVMDKSSISYRMGRFFQNIID
ncbi:MAG: hypothetical protein KJ941_11345 [Bacteroidetes bacterium]|nr:hypothetical protein [Bacteroidota bacterium]